MQISKFQQACYDNDIEVIRQYIAQGGDVNATTDGDGWTGLMCASRYSQIDSEKELINAAADVNIQDDGWTGLMCASRYNQIDSVKELINAGADVNIQDNDGMTALMLAAIYNSPDCVNALIEAGADISIKNNVDGRAWTALVWVLYNANYAMAAMLVEAGADIYENTSLNKRSWSAINYCKDKRVKEQLVNIYISKRQTQQAIDSVDKPEVITDFDPER